MFMAIKNLLKMTIDDLPYYNSYNPIVATTTTLLCPPFYRALLDPSAAKRRDYWLETLISFSMIKVYICNDLPYKLSSFFQYLYSIQLLNILFLALYLLLYSH